jgi:Ca2+/Na+ antiporter
VSFSTAILCLFQLKFTPFIALCLIYLFYNVYLIIILKINKKARLEASMKLPEYAKTLFPITRLEKKTWIFVALTAGITEEIVYQTPINWT